MDKDKQDLIGSPSRDMFKHLHKKLSKGFYGCDLDFRLIAKYPREGIVAHLDVKLPNDIITYAEVIGYNEDLKQGIPIYIVRMEDPINGPFKIYQYLNGNPRPDPPDVELRFICQCEDWEAYAIWEQKVRREYYERIIKEIQAR